MKMFLDFKYTQAKMATKKVPKNQIHKKKKSFSSSQFKHEMNVHISLPLI